MRSFATITILKAFGFVFITWLCDMPTLLIAEDVPVADFSQREAIEKRLEAARNEIKKLAVAAQPALREGLQNLEARCENHLAILNVLTEAQSKLVMARQEAVAWKEFSEPPPYSIILADEIRESLAILNFNQHAAKVQLQSLKAEVDIFQEGRLIRKQAERRFIEIADKSDDTEPRQSATHSAKIENLYSRIIAEKIGRLQLLIAAAQADLEAYVAKKELVARQLKAIEGNIVFTSKDLDAIQKQISGEREEASRILVTKSNSEQVLNPLLPWKIEFLDLKKTFWHARFAAMNSEDSTVVHSSIAKIKGIKGPVDGWAEIADLRLTGELAEKENYDEALLREASVQVRKMQRRIGFTISDLEGKSLQDKGSLVIDKIISAIRDLLNTELYMVEESDIVDGNKIAIHRAITVGKLVRLTCILTIGWLILRFLSRRIRATLTRKKRISQDIAVLTAKWFFGCGLALLLLYSLRAVSIPLTIFAFLGGALAIGLGFGTQTLLKNFVSGIILIFERPLKVGDVVEVEGIIGTIKRVGVRASVIRHFDGIETLVPNSILLENQLTNWTLSNSVIRHTVLVGVAYGSPTREVSRLLSETAAEHGLVMKDPAPEIRLEDFGDNAMTFSLLFWLDALKASRKTIASDLRLMIDKAFAEAGITIAFPQRDIHLDSDRPLRVELSQSSEAETKLNPQAPSDSAQVDASRNGFQK